MKKLILAVALISTIVIACQSNIDDKEKQDSLEAARAADSMLKAASEADTMGKDATVIDTSRIQDSLQKDTLHKKEMR
jgi:hypothetical protein